MRSVDDVNGCDVTLLTSSSAVVDDVTIVCVLNVTEETLPDNKHITEQQ